jgi:hypothetical protein
MRPILCTVLLILAVGSASISHAAVDTIIQLPGGLASEYCEGWQSGWNNGWKYVKGQYSIPPIAPICPIPRIGEDGYRGGYNRGFAAGLRRAENN